MPFVAFVMVCVRTSRRSFGLLASQRMFSVIVCSLPFESLVMFRHVGRGSSYHAERTCLRHAVSSALFVGANLPTESLVLCASLERAAPCQAFCIARQGQGRCGEVHTDVSLRGGRASPLETAETLARANCPHPSLAGSVSAYVSRAAKLFNEMDKTGLTITATGCGCVCVLLSS